MKKLALLSIIVAIAVAFTMAEAKKKVDGAKVYSNSKYNFELSYPGNWIVNELKTEPLRMAAVCFGPKKKCELGSFGKEPQAQLVITDLKAMQKISFKSDNKGEKAAKGSKKEQSKSICDTVEQTSLRWTGSKASWVTIRCPEKNNWRYTATVMMQRKAGKIYDMYNLNCSMLSDEKDKDKSLAEYREDLKSQCNNLVTSMKFTR